MWRRFATTTLRVIKAAQSLGFTLKEIVELRAVGVRADGARASGLHAGAMAKLAEVEQKIADLQAIRAALIAARDAGCDDLDQCATSEECPVPFAGPGDVRA